MRRWERVGAVTTDRSLGLGLYSLDLEKVLMIKGESGAEEHRSWKRG